MMKPIDICMRLISHLKLPPLKVFAVTFSAAIAGGCVTDQLSTGGITIPDDGTTIDGQTVEPAVVADVVTDQGDYIPAVPTKWVVLSGDHLWGIAGVENVYNNSEYWPLLYKANLSKIRDADLIYPGQVLEIERDLSVRQINAAIIHARLRGAWSLGEVEESDKGYLSTSP
ncbi:MAG: LysM peptidoglycan-binding domain-containing protein [Gammaproteobacteria bacterium]